MPDKCAPGDLSEVELKQGPFKESTEYRTLKVSTQKKKPKKKRVQNDMHKKKSLVCSPLSPVCLSSVNE